MHWNNDEEIRTDAGIESQVSMIRPITKDPVFPSDTSTGHEVDMTGEIGNRHIIDRGPYYIARTIDTMEEWNSKPREGYHVSDVCLCPRLNVFRKIDRLPIDAKTVSIFAVGKAIHEAVQMLYRTDKRTFEIEKYVEHQDIQGSVDIHDRRRNIRLEFKTTRSSDI